MANPQDIGQESYPKFMARGYAGSRADAGHADEVFVYSRCFAPYGRLYIFDPTAANFVNLPNAADGMNRVAGVTVFEQVIGEIVRFSPPFPEGYPALERIIMRTRGRIIVYPEQPVALLDPVFFRFNELNPAGQTTLGLVTFSQVPTNGRLSLSVVQDGTPYVCTQLTAPITAANLQNALNSVASPVPTTAVVTGDPIRGFKVDWGDPSKDHTFSIAQNQNSLTAGRNSVLFKYAETQPGYPAANRFGAGSFRKDDDHGSAANANQAGGARKFRWFTPSDQDGKAILEII